MTWRRLNNVLHRDVGYLIVGLTLVFGVSGLALNHRADWTPSYRQQKTAKQIAPLTATDRDGQVREALTQLGVTGEPRNAFRPDVISTSGLGGYRQMRARPIVSVMTDRTKTAPAAYRQSQTI